MRSEHLFLPLKGKITLAGQSHPENAKQISDNSRVPQIQYAASKDVSSFYFPQQNIHYYSIFASICHLSYNLSKLYPNIVPKTTVEHIKTNDA